ncbi:hypothetical protein H5410_027430 [Solanum commersonii]|uniref:Uncharacterized protein n=1 Tax=Solanum commersonii TaxID=4109 RepID=A0A9J5YZU3_SOLCO|nr:hypothetical protein H5410_027430 [Solanum commersonii]
MKLINCQTTLELGMKKFYIGRPDYILASKLKALKHKLKEWNKSEQGSLGQQRKNVLEKLAVVEKIATDRALTEDEATEKATLLLKLEGIIKNEEIYWRQRSRSVWLKEGDKNTNFFHKMANAHKRYNNIDQLLIQGNIVQDPERIQGEIVEFYQKLYSENVQWRPSNNFLNLVLTQENLMKRGITLCSRCFFFLWGNCRNSQSLVHPVPFTGQLWSLFLRRKNISWVMPGRIAEALYSWEEAGLQTKNRSNWRIIPATIWWTV